MGHENAEGMAHVGVRLTAQLGRARLIFRLLLFFYWLCIGGQTPWISDIGRNLLEFLQ
jgi:hypothetical protein